MTFFQNDNSPKLKANSKGRIKLPGETSLKDILEGADPNFIDFLEHCFEWDPENRFSPHEALQNVWVREGIKEIVKARRKLK